MFTEDQMNNRSFLNALIELKVFFDETKSNRKISLGINRLNLQINQLLEKLDSEYETDRENSYDALAKFLYVFYQQLTFKGVDIKHKKFSDFLDIDYVIKNRIGHDFIISALFCALIKDKGIIAAPVFFLGQMLIRVDLENQEPIFLEAQTGNELAYRDIELMLRAYEESEKTDENLLEPQETSYLVFVFLGLLKTAYLFENSLDLALKTSNLMVSLKPNDPHLRRDRGMILARLGCPQAAVNEFNYYLEKCPNDPMTEITKAHISAILPEAIPLH